MKKAILMVLTGLIMFGGCATSRRGVKPASIDIAQQGYLRALKSDRSGLVEDVIFQIALCHMQNNFEACDELKLQLAVLSEKGATERIREQAGLVLRFLYVRDLYVMMDLKSEFYDRGRLFSHITRFLPGEENRESLMTDLNIISSSK